MSYSSYSQNNYSSRPPPYQSQSNYNPRSKTSNQMPSVPPINWRDVKLEPFQKNFYVPHPSIIGQSSDKIRQTRKEMDITISDESIAPVVEFDKCGLPPFLQKEIAAQGFTSPTPIQSQAWPAVLSGHDLIGIADTGSGKTLAFLLPAILHINAQAMTRSREGPIALVVAPTRELAMQIEAQVKLFSSSSCLRFTCVYGGVPKYSQKRDLQRGVDLVVATPGRLLDFLESGDANLRRVTYLVLDEADRMLDMGFEPSIRSIIGQIRPDRQTLLFSATWPKNIRQLAAEFLSNPIKVNIGSMEISSCKNVQQDFDVVDEGSKMMKALMYLRDLPKHEKVLIFTATKVRTNEISTQLLINGFKSNSINGDKSQYERQRVLSEFRDGRINIMVGTDVASRGIDIRDIRVVINYDFPNTIEDYVHRIGRTGRAMSNGKSYTMLTRKDANKTGDLIKLIRNDKKEVPRCIHDLFNNYGGKSRGNGRGNRYRSNMYRRRIY